MDIKIYKFEHRGTMINKIAFSEIEDVLIDKGMNVEEAFELMADEREFVYVSNGFVRGLQSEEIEPGEWHHYFTKDLDGDFRAEKLNFN